MKKRKSLPYFRNMIFGLVAVCLFAVIPEISASATTIWCGLYGSKDSTDGIHYAECGQKIYMKIGTDDDSYSIDYTTLSVSDGYETTFNDSGYDYSGIIHGHTFDKPGTYTSRWTGKWANSTQTFDISDYIVVRDTLPDVTNPSNVTAREGTTATFSVIGTGTILVY